MTTLSTTFKKTFKIPGTKTKVTVSVCLRRKYPPKLSVTVSQ